MPQTGLQTQARRGEHVLHSDAGQESNTSLEDMDLGFLTIQAKTLIFSSDRSSCSDDGLLYIRQRQLFQSFTQSIDAIDVTSVTLSRLISINAIDVTGYLGDIFGIFLEYFWDIFGIFWEYFWDILGIFLGYFGDILGIFWGYFGDILGIF